MSAIGDYIHWSIQGYNKKTDNIRHPNKENFSSDYNKAHQNLQKIIEEKKDEKIIKQVTDQLNKFFNEDVKEKLKSDDVFRKEYEQQINKNLSDSAKLFSRVKLNNDGSISHGARRFQISGRHIITEEKLKEYVTILKKYKKKVDTDLKSDKNNVSLQKIEKDIDNMVKLLSKEKLIGQNYQNTEISVKQLNSLLNQAAQLFAKNYASTVSTALERTLGFLFFSTTIDEDNLSNRMMKDLIEQSLGDIIGSGNTEEQRSYNAYSENLIFGKASNLKMKRSITIDGKRTYRYLTAAEAKKRSQDHKDYAFKILNELTNEYENVSVSSFNTTPEKVDLSFELTSPKFDLDSDGFKGSISLKSYDGKGAVKAVEGSPMLYMLQSIASINKENIPFINHYINLFTIKRDMSKKLEKEDGKYKSIKNGFTTDLRNSIFTEQASILLYQWLTWVALTGQGTKRYIIKEQDNEQQLKVLRIEDYPNIFAFYDKSTGEFIATSMRDIAGHAIKNHKYKISNLPPTGKAFFDKIGDTDIMQKLLTWSDDPYEQGIIVNQRISHILARLHDIKLTIHITPNLKN